MNAQQILKIAAAWGMGFIAQGAQASAIQLIEQDAAGQGNAFAGSAARADSAATVFANPAGMIKLPGKNLSMGVTAIDIKARFENGASIAPPTQLIQPPFTQATPAGSDADGGTLGYAPNFYYSQQLDDRWALGIGFNAPFGLKTDYPEDFRGRFLARKSDIKTMNFNPSVAYKLNETVALGFGANYQKFDAELTQAVITAGLAAGEGYLTQKGDSWAWGWNVGVLIDLTPATRLGVSYRSKVDHKIKGNYSFDNVPAPILAAAGFNAMSGDGTATVTLPEIWTFSLAHQLDERWQLLADLSRTGWGDRSELRIQYANGSKDQFNTFDWKATTRVAVGASYQLNDSLKLRAGLATDQSPVTDDNRIARMPDSSRTWYALGFQYKPNKTMAFDVGYTYIKGKDAKINESGTPPNPVSYGVLNGAYRNSGQELGVQYSLSF